MLRTRAAKRRSGVRRRLQAHGGLPEPRRLAGRGAGKLRRRHHPLPELQQEIQRCILEDEIRDEASTQLRDLRRRKLNLEAKIKEKLNQILRTHKQYINDGYITSRGGLFRAARGAAAPKANSGHGGGYVRLRHHGVHRTGRRIRPARRAGRHPDAGRRGNAPHPVHAQRDDRGGGAAHPPQHEADGRPGRAVCQGQAFGGDGRAPGCRSAASAGW